MINIINPEDKLKYGYELSVYQNTRSKKHLDKPLFYDPKKNTERVSPSKLYNYISGNQIRDVIPSSNNWSELSMIRTTNGNNYEKKIMEQRQHIKISNHINRHTFNISKNIIREGLLNPQDDSKGILYSVPLINPKNNTGGIADILIRSDLIESVLDIDYPYKHERLHYICVDIKYSNNTIDYYKSQLYIYNQALKHIQKYETRCAYMYKKNNIIQPVFFNEDIMKMTRQAVSWLRRLSNYKKLGIDNGSILRKEKISIYNNITNITPVRVINSNINNKYVHFIKFYTLNLDELSLELSERKPFIWFIALLTKNLETREKNIKYIFARSIANHEEIRLLSNMYNIIKSYNFGNIYYWSDNWNEIEYYPNMFNIKRYYQNHKWKNLDIEQKITSDEFIVSAWKYLQNPTHTYMEIFKDYAENELKILGKLCLISNQSRPLTLIGNTPCL